MLKAFVTFFVFVIVGLWIRRDKSSSKTKTPWSERLLMMVSTIVGMLILSAMFCFCYWLVHTYPIAALLLLAGLLAWMWHENRGKTKDRR